jgi:hypothetical protein
VTATAVAFIIGGNRGMSRISLRRSVCLCVLINLFLVAFAISMPSKSLAQRNISTEATHEKYRRLLLQLAHARMLEGAGNKADAQEWFNQAGLLAQELDGTGTENSTGFMLKSKAGDFPQQIATECGTYLPHLAACYAFFEAARLASNATTKHNLLIRASSFSNGAGALGEDLNSIQKILHLGSLERFRNRKGLTDRDVATVNSDLKQLYQAVKKEMPGAPGDSGQYSHYANLLFLVETADDPIPDSFLKAKAENSRVLTTMINRLQARDATKEQQKKLISDVYSVLSERIDWPRLADFKIDAESESFSVRVDSPIPVALDIKDTATGQVTELLPQARFSSDPVRESLPEADSQLQIKLPHDGPFFDLCSVLHPNPDDKLLAQAVSPLEHWSVVTASDLKPLSEPTAPAGLFLIKGSKPGDKVRVYIPGGRDLLSPTQLLDNNAVPAFGVKADDSTSIAIELLRNDKPVGGKHFNETIVCQTPVTASYSVAGRVGPLWLVLVKASSYGALESVIVDDVSYPTGSQAAGGQAASSSYVLPALCTSPNPHVVVQTRMPSHDPRKVEANISAAKFDPSPSEAKLISSLLPPGVALKPTDADLQPVQDYYLSKATPDEPNSLPSKLLSAIYDYRRTEITGSKNLDRTNSESLKRAVGQLTDLQTLASALKARDALVAQIGEFKKKASDLDQILIDKKNEEAKIKQIADAQKRKEQEEKDRLKREQDALSVPAGLVSADVTWSDTGLAWITVKLDHVHSKVTTPSAKEDTIRFSVNGAPLVFEASANGQTFQALYAADMRGLQSVPLRVTVEGVRADKPTNQTLTADLPTKSVVKESDLLKTLPQKVQDSVNTGIVNGTRLPADDPGLRAIAAQRFINIVQVIDTDVRGLGGADDRRSGICDDRKRREDCGGYRVSA